MSRLRTTRKVSREDILSSPTPYPSISEHSRLHVPIAHSKLLTETETLLKEMHLLINEETHVLGNFDKDDVPHIYFGMFDLQLKSNEHQMRLGIRNSHNKKYSASCFIGSTNAICKNLSWHSEHKVGRKHTRNILEDGLLEKRLDDIISSIPDVLESQTEMFNRYKETSLTVEQQDHLICESVRRKIVSPAKVNRIFGEIKHPTFPAFAEHKDTLYGLYSAFTHIMKSQNEFSFADNSMKLQNMIKEKTK